MEGRTAGADVEGSNVAWDHGFIFDHGYDASILVSGVAIHKIHCSSMHLDKRACYELGLEALYEY